MNRLNTRQRVILIVGALALVAVVFIAPDIGTTADGAAKVASAEQVMANAVDLLTTLVRSLAIGGATLLMALALKDSPAGS